MKSTIALILVVAILAPIVVKNMVILSFYANREQIAKELCVERNQLNSCCKGSCVLEKDLNKVENENDKVPAPFKDKTETVYVILSSDALLPMFDSAIEYVAYYTLNRSCLFKADILHPPSV